jgi:hypothetical protein
MYLLNALSVQCTKVQNAFQLKRISLRLLLTN